MKFAHILLGSVMASGIAGHGQTEITLQGAQSMPNQTKLNFPSEVTVPTPPLKCEKYQHVEHGIYQWEPIKGVKEVKEWRPEDRCIDNLHTVTEREWQALSAAHQANLDALIAIQRLIQLQQKQINLILKVKGSD